MQGLCWEFQVLNTFLFFSTFSYTVWGNQSIPLYYTYLVLVKCRKMQNIVFSRYSILSIQLQYCVYLCGHIKSWTITVLFTTGNRVIVLLLYQLENQFQKTQNQFRKHIFKILCLLTSPKFVCQDSIKETEPVGGM